MAKLLQFVILTSLGVLFIIDLPNLLANRVYYKEHHNNESLDTNCNRASSKRPCYNPFGYKNCGLRKIRFDWMRERNRSFFCKRGVSGSCRSGPEELDDHSDEYRPIGKPRIRSGFFPELGEFPSFVQLFFYDRLANGTSTATNCGGTLLNEYLVLTRAECLKNVTLGFAHAGSIKHFASKDFKGQRQLIKRACLPKDPIPPEDNNRWTRYDWAILEMEGQFELDENVQPACVNFDYKLARNIRCVMVGFGSTNTTTKSSPLLKAAIVRGLDPQPDEHGFIWTVDTFPVVGSGLGCPGDSGGPLYCFENCSGEPKMYVVGVASFVNWRFHPCKSYGNEFVFVNTISYRKLMPSLIKEMMHKREKRSLRRYPEGEMDSKPLTREGFRCVNFEVGQG